MSKGPFELRAGSGSFDLRTGPGSFGLYSNDPFKTKVQQAKERLIVKKERELAPPAPPPLEATRQVLKKGQTLSPPEAAERAARNAPSHEEELKRRQAAEAIRAKLRAGKEHGERGR